jgi:gluconokinase
MGKTLRSRPLKTKGTGQTGHTRRQAGALSKKRATTLGHGPHGRRTNSTAWAQGAGGAGGKPAILILVGVSGSGKSTVGKLLSRELRCEFYEGDDFHSQANKDKMRRGVALTDEDRWPWLEAIRRLILELLAKRKRAVIACSALKRAYRDVLRLPGVIFVYLKGPFRLLRERLEHRRGHFFDPDLLASQCETLEEPHRAIVVMVDQSPKAIVREIKQGLFARRAK